MKNSKKGFTLVELLVVIAILAILATVAVVGYTSFIEKANISADQQAVTQMNNALKAENIVDKFENIYEVQAFLLTCDLDIDGYRPLRKDTFFFWDKSENTIVYTDKNYKVTYPENQLNNTDRSDWFTLSGEIREEAYPDAVEGVYTISTPEQLYKLANDYNGGNIEIVIAGDINMMGASLGFKPTGDFTLRAEDSVTISHIAQTDISIKISKNNVGENVKYGGGLVSEATLEGTSIKFENITLENCIFGSTTQSAVGGFVGKSNGLSKIEFINCDILNCEMNADYRAGAFVGQFTNAGTITFDSNCSVVNTTITTQRGIGAYLVGMTSVRNNVSGANDVTIENTTIVVATDDIDKIYDGGMTDSGYNTGYPRYNPEQMKRTDILYFYTNHDNQQANGNQCVPKQ